MSVKNIFVVMIINPYLSKLPEILLFKDELSSKKFIIDEIDSKLEAQKGYVCGLKGNKEQHLKKYVDFLEENSEVCYYGEYLDYFNTLEPYEMKYIIEKKELEI